MTKLARLGVCRGTGTGSTVLLVTDGTTLLGWSLCVVGLVTLGGWRLELVVAVSGYVLQMRGDGAITTPVSLAYFLRATERSEGGSRRSRNTGSGERFVCLPHSLQTKAGLKVAVASLSRHQKVEQKTLFTLLDSLTQQGKVRSWVLLGCRNHQPTFPCFIYQQSAIPYVALAALPDSRR